MKKKGLKILLASLLAVPLIAGLNNSDKVEANNVAHEHDLIKLERPGSGGEAVTGGDFSSSSAWQWKNADIQAVDGKNTGHLKAGVNDASFGQVLSLKRDTDYTVTYKAKLSENGNGINCDIRIPNAGILDGTWQGISGSEWKEYTFKFNSGDHESLRIEFVKWGDASDIVASEAWISDVSVTDGGEGVEDDTTYDFIWADDFNEGKLNEDNWDYELGCIRGIEQQHYVKSEENVYIDTDETATDGKLVLKATDRAKEDQYDNPRDNSRRVIYNSGSVRTHGKQEFLYGRIEMKAKLPKGQGVFPAFWTLGADFSLDGDIAADQGYGWPRCGEVDIMELTGDSVDGSYNNRTVYQTLHYGTDDNDSGKYAGNGTAASLNSGNFNDEYHVFGINWSKGKIEWYVDNQIVRTVDYSDDQAAVNALDKPQYIQFNLAMGGAWPGPVGTDLAGTTYDIDYVYYARSPQQQADAEAYYANVPEINGASDITMQKGTTVNLLENVTTDADHYLDFSINDAPMFVNNGGKTEVSLVCKGKDDLESLKNLPAGTYDLHITAIPKSAKPDPKDPNQLDRTQAYVLNRKTVKLTIVESDKNILQEKIAEAEALLLKTDVYTEKTLDYLNKSVNWAKEINDDVSANQEYIDSAIALLDDSMARLKEK